MIGNGADVTNSTLRPIRAIRRASPSSASRRTRSCSATSGRSSRTRASMSLVDAVATLAPELPSLRALDRRRRTGARSAARAQPRPWASPTAFGSRAASRTMTIARHYAIDRSLRAAAPAEPPHRSRHAAEAARDHGARQAPLGERLRRAQRADRRRRERPALRRDDAARPRRRHRGAYERRHELPELGTRARQWVSRHRSWESAVRPTLPLYERLVQAEEGLRGRRRSPQVPRRPRKSPSHIRREDTS